MDTKCTSYGSVRTNRVKLATCAATVLSVVALFISAILTPIIYSEVQSIWADFDVEIEEFRVKF